MADAPKILGTDTLRKMYPKVNSAIDNANEALTTSISSNNKSTSAVNTANSAETKADSVQAQFNQVVIEGDSSVEAAQARVKADGTTFTTLRDRMNDSDTQISDVAKNVKSYGAKGDGITDDTAAVQSAINALTDGDQLRFKGTYKITAPLVIQGKNNIVLNLEGASLVYMYEQSTSPSYFESLFVIRESANVEMYKGKLSYNGTFDFGADYGGFISGVFVYDSHNLVFNGVEAEGFNRSGINIATDSPSSPYCYDNVVKNCNLHHNRVAGVGFGNTDRLQITYNKLQYNGIESSFGTGYGLAGWSSCQPKNTEVTFNDASYNYRKGIDFHSGFGGVISYNTIKANRLWGIYILPLGTKEIGKWIIKNNTISDMQDYSYTSTIGMALGCADGQGTGVIETYFDVSNNIFENIGRKSGVNSVYPLFLYGSSLSKGIFSIRGNKFNLGSVTRLIQTFTTPSSAGNYYDLIFENNIVVCAEVYSMFIAFLHQTQRHLSVSFNTIEILGNYSQPQLVVHENTQHPDATTRYIGNTVKLESYTGSLTYDFFYIKRSVNEFSDGNTVNNVKVRSWDGYKFKSSGNSAPATGLWTTGSVIENNSPSPGGYANFICTGGGSPGSWKGANMIQT